MLPNNTHHRAIKHLHVVSRMYPDLTTLVNKFRSQRELPNWCFLSLNDWLEIEFEQYPHNALIEQVSNAAKLAAIGTWRYSQGIYQINEDLFTALIASPISSILPSEVFYRLPEWSIYIEIPESQWMGESLFGFWAHLEWDKKAKRTELRFLLDCKSGLIPIPLHLGNWTIYESVEKMISEAKKQADLPVELTKAISEEINPIISVLLYLCSDSPEVDNNRVPGTIPSHPVPVKTKKGWRLFPAEKSQFWSVGTMIGEQLRLAENNSDEPTGKKVRTHLRRGHWHGYWIGPKISKRRFSYRWISPLVVAGQNHPILKIE
ncbi:hypothetical protein Neut_2535 (plasmid) [Nitrosomonas eutropha C91]|uniref:Uncharacterized protein n=3 Tax=Nitrosomonadaceae TaxID=206379 RepID=A0ABX5M420_9PROT|nr:hypothetical protein Neut_2535 [Nitrosomonas eutropha C91]MXS80743.1 hypothetical protein [Nitrosomonas sp. GH22]PXV76074.1 hypothetical protein C8R14_1357 [Nitrosomonas eutropha]SCX15673.1 hypothetical protein SAMN05216379_1104 [Nitrosomonas eutropha]